MAVPLLLGVISSECVSRSGRDLIWGTMDWDWKVLTIRLTEFNLLKLSPDYAPYRYFDYLVIMPTLLCLVISLKRDAC